MERLVPLPGGTVLCVEEFGSPGDPLVLQLEGHMAQLIATPESYCRALAERGVRVVRVDNRDVGRSSRCGGVDYSLAEMARDVHELLGVLDSPAVVCGRSMGGAIAQLLAVTYPQDVLGLGLFFTFAKEAGLRGLPGGGPGGVAPIGPAPFWDEGSYLGWLEATLPGIAGSEHPFSQQEVAWLARTAWSRGVSWDGFERQRRAMAFTEPWADRLAGVAVPTVVVHGAEDSVVPVAAGRRLAELVPGARLLVVDGLGHQQPAALDGVFVQATVGVVPRGLGGGGA